jgi:chromosome segregation ATPase
MPVSKKIMKDEIPKEESTTISAETQPAEESPLNKTEKRAPSKFSRFLRMLGVGILLLALGASALFLAVYIPQTNDLKAQIKAAQSEVTTAKTEVTTAKSEIESLKAVEAQLTQAKKDIVTLQSQLDKVSAQKSVYQIQSNVNTARVALLKDDASGSAQSLEYIIQNLKSLEVPAFPDITKNLETRLTNIRTTITTDKTKALSDLEALFNDLVLLADNIK